MRHPHRIVATDGVREPDLVKRRFAASAHGLDKIDTFTEGTPWVAATGTHFSFHKLLQQYCI